MVLRGMNGHDGQGTIMILLFIIPLSRFIEVKMTIKANRHHHVLSLSHSLIRFIEVRMVMMANWGTIMFLLFVIPLSWFIEVIIDEAN
jgi:hypothetical protein